MSTLLPNETSSSVDVELRDENRSQEDQKFGKLQIFAFSIGHFYNDLCASMWFTYLMIFLEKVMNFNSVHAGFLMLTGQVTDAVSTVAVGLFSDGTLMPSHIVSVIGRRKSWHILGTFCVTISFSFVFGNCFFCSPLGAAEWIRTAQLIPFIMIFQFGWACVQVSHLALIPELSRSDSVRMKMNSFRYGFTVMANLFIFTTLYLLLRQNKPETEIGAGDLTVFKVADAIAIGVGVFSTSIFILLLREPRKNMGARSNSFTSLSSRILRMSWHDWLSHPQFYQVALLYMFSRLFINISQIYFPFYIVVTQKHSKEYVAILPTVAYVTSLFISTIIMPCITKKITTKHLLISGSLFGLVNCVIMHFNLPGIDIFGIAILLGITQSILLISSLGITATLINRNTESGAFVYGAMSFLDKISNGVVCQIVEVFSSKCATEHCTAECSIFYRNVMVIIPGISVICIFLILMGFNHASLGIRRNEIPYEGIEENSQEIVVE